MEKLKDLPIKGRHLLDSGTFFPGVLAETVQ